MAVQACSVGGLPRSTGTLSTPGARAELAVCLNLFQLNWAFIAATLAVFVVGLRLAGFQLRVSSYLLYFGIAGVYGVVGYLNLKSKLRRSPRVYTLLFFIAQIVLQILLLVSIGYLAATANFPMQDTNLLAMDRALGLDFRAYLALVNRPGLIDALAVTYDSIRWQLVLIVVVVPLLGHYRRAAEFSLGFGLTLAITTLISTLFPATGVYETVGLHSADHPNFEPSVYNATLRELPLVRDGTVKLLDAFQLGPLLTFPSFHAISAVLYMWVLWPIRWVRGIGVLWNGVMMAATPIGGGHYFVDVFAGVVLAIASIWVIKRIGALLAPEQDRERFISQISTVDPLAMVEPDGDLSPQSS